MDGLDALMTLQQMAEDDEDGTASAGAFNPVLNRNNLTNNNSNWPSYATTNLDAARPRDTSKMVIMSNSIMGASFCLPTAESPKTPTTQGSDHSTTRIIEVNTGEPTSNAFNYTSQLESRCSNGENQSEILRSLSEPLLSNIPEIELTGGFGLKDDLAEANSYTRASLNRRNSLFGDVFDQLLTSDPDCGRGEDNFADGFYSPPPDAMMPRSKMDHPARRRALSEPPNFDLFDAPEPIPISNFTTDGQSDLYRALSEPADFDLFDMPEPIPISNFTTKDQTNLRRPQPSRPSFDNTTIVAVETKTGESSERSKHVFEPGRSRQKRSIPPFKRSRSADSYPIKWDFSDPSDDQQLDDRDDFLQFLDPQDQQQFQCLGIYNREKPKRRRSLPHNLTDLEEFSFDEDKGDNNRFGQKNKFDFDSSFFSAPPSETSHKRHASPELTQMALGNDEVGNLKVMSSLNASSSFSKRNLTQQKQQLSNKTNAISFDQLPDASPAQQNMQNMPYPAPSAFDCQQICSVIQLPNRNTFNSNILSLPNKEDEVTEIMAAIKETQNNLQILYRVATQQHDTEAIESIAKAFELTAACSQFTLTSQLQRAHELLRQAWVYINFVENRVASPWGGVGPSTPFFGQSYSDMHAKHPPNDVLLQTMRPLCLPKQKSKKKKEQKQSKKEVTVLELSELPPQSKDDPAIIMSRLNALMERTLISQRELQMYDKQNGLPRSHAQTMVNSNRSRQELLKDIVLAKWDAGPLVNSKSEENDAKPEEVTSIEKGVATSTSETNNQSDEEEEESFEDAFYDAFGDTRLYGKNARNG